MAHVKQKGAASRNGRDSIAKRLGVKLFAGETAKIGDIIVRQRGSKYRAGDNVSVGSDDSLFSDILGSVKFSTKKVRKFNNKLENATFISVIPFNS